MNSVTIYKRVIYGVVAVFLLTSGSLGVSAGLLQLQQSDYKQRADLSKRKMAELIDLLERSKNAPVMTGKRQLQAFQVAFDRVLEENGCKLVEISSSGDTGLYLSRYHKVSNDKGWVQISVNCQVTGRLQNIVTSLKKVALSTMPIELESISFTRPSGKSNSPNDVNAKLTVNLLNLEGTS